MQMQIQIQLQTFSRRSRGRNESGPWQNLYLTFKQVAATNFVSLFCLHFSQLTLVSQVQ